MYKIIAFLINKRSNEINLTKGNFFIHFSGNGSKWHFACFKGHKNIFNA
jgi:hypothetical protein